MTRFFTRPAALLSLAALLLPGLRPAQAQELNLTQANFTGVLVPQFLANGNNSGAATGTAAFPGPRLSVVFRATLTNLSPSTAYRYNVLAATQADFGTANSGAGVLLFINAGATPAASTYTSISTGSVGTAGQYATFATDAAGAYTGWFGFVNSNNAGRFQTAGTVLFPAITLALDAGATAGTVVARRALNQSLTVLTFAAGAGATNGTLLTGSSAATPKNLVYVYDNVAGTGRPLSGALVENSGVVTGTTQTGTNAYTYSTANGAYTTVVPNTLANGIRRVEQRSVVDGSVVADATDADGTWASGVNTVNPTGGAAAPLVLTATDTPLGAATAPTATLTATPAGPLTFRTSLNTPSEPQTVTVSGSGLTGAVSVAVSTGYQLANEPGGPYSGSISLATPNGTLAATPVYVRLAAATLAGPVNGTLTVMSTGSSTQTVTLNGTITTTTASRASQALPGLRVFPNPARAQLTVSLPKAGAARVALRDLAGRLVLAASALPATGRLALPAALPAGVYLLEVAQGEETAVRRVVVE